MGGERGVGDDDGGRGGAGRIEGSGDGSVGGIRGQEGHGARDGTSGAAGNDSAPVLAAHGVSWLEYKRPAALSTLFSRGKPNILKKDYSLPGGKRRKIDDDPPHGVDGVVGRGGLSSADLLQDLCDSD